MFKLDLMLWLPVLSAVLGYILHSLSADGGASILDRFNVKARLPVSVVATLVLVIGIAAGAVDNFLGGQDWQHALATAIASVLAGTFGVTRQHASSAGAAALLLVFMTTATGCQAFLHEARVITQDMGMCLIDHADLPDDKALELCGITTAYDETQRQLALAIVHEHRSQAAKEAIDAAQRAEKDTLSKLLNVQLAAEAHAKCDAVAK